MCVEITSSCAKSSIKKAVQLYSFMIDLTFKDIESMGYSNRGQDGLTLVAFDILNKLKTVEKYLDKLPDNS